MSVYPRATLRVGAADIATEYVRVPENEVEVPTAGVNWPILV